MLKSFVDTVEHEHARFQSKLLKNKLKEFCKVNGVGFSESFKDQLIDNNLLELENTLTVWLQLHDPLFGHETQWQALDQKLQKSGQKILVCTDSFVSENVFRNIVFHQPLALLGVKHFHINEQWFDQLAQDHQPTKLFSCFINRVEPVRQSWFYFLYNSNLLDRGHISFLLFNHEKPTLTELELFDQNHQQHLYYLEQFEKAYQNLRSRVPYKNFAENGLLWDKICDSKYSLVLDTSAPDDQLLQCFVSEKTARTIMLPTIDLLFVQKGTLTHLDSLGIKTHSYGLGIDHLSWQDRQTKIIDALVKDSCEYNFKELLEVARNNHHVLKTIYENNKDFGELFDLIMDIK
jgi:hypothetical protein